jgi:hypothetical protein
MKMKHFFKSALARNIMRHRQHHRFIHNLGMQARQFGPGRGLLLLGAIALAGTFMQRRRTAQTAQLPEVGSVGPGY